MEIVLTLSGWRSPHHHYNNKLSTQLEQAAHSLHHCLQNVIISVDAHIAVVKIIVIVITFGVDGLFWCDYVKSQ